MEDELYRKLSHLKEEQDESNLQNRDKMIELETGLEKIKKQLYFERHVVNESSASGKVVLVVYNNFVVVYYPFLIFFLTPSELN